MEVDASLDEFFDGSVGLEEGVAIGLQVGHISYRYVQEPQDDIRTLTINHHNIVNPDTHCHQRDEE